MRTSSLIAAQILPIDFAGLSNSKFGGVQATRRLGRYMNAFASYTAVAQSSSMQITVLNLPTNLLSGLYQVVGFGIGYSPQEMHLKK